MFKKCSVEECARNVVAKGLCDLHYRRQHHHGHLEQTRPVDWGTREKHALFQSWTWMRRAANGGVDSRWDDFWQFVRDVGERPSPDHKVKRKDSTKQFGPDNFFWKEVEFKKRRSESEKEYRARYMREYYRVNPERQRASSLKKNYGISVDEYDALAEAQGHKCAICGLAESDINDRSGYARRLAVDHCHRKNAVRALLCGSCNKGLGYFKDDPDLLNKAIAYLKAHSWAN